MAATQACAPDTAVAVFVLQLPCFLTGKLANAEPQGVGGPFTLWRDYYNSLDAGVTLDKPQPKISLLFASILSQLEQRRIARWTEIGVALSIFSPSDQNRVARMLKKLEKGVHKNWKRRGHKNMVISIPSRASGHALAYVMFKNGNADGKQDYMNHAVSTALESNHVQTVIVVGRNIDRDDVAYDTIALFESPMALASDSWQLPLDPMPNTSNN